MSPKSHWLVRYGMAVVVMLAAVALRWALVPIMGLNIPYLTVFPAMMLVAVTFGAGPAVLATITGIVLAEYYFVPPIGIELDLGFTIRAGIMLLTGGYVGWVSERLRRARTQADAEAASARAAQEALQKAHDELEQRVQERTAELRTAMDALARASAYNRRLIEASLDPLVTIGPDGKITDVNAATEGATGRTRQELIGTDFSGYFTDPQEARAGYELVFKEKQVRDYPLELRHRDGRLTPVLYNASVYTDESGAVVGIFAAARDISERKRAEERTREVLEELARSNKELEQFAYVASHDLQEPLRMVASYVQLLARRYQGKLDKDADDFIGFAVDGASRMQRLIEDLLTFSRVGTRGRPFVPTDCAAVLNEVVANLQVAIQDSGAQVTHDPLPVVPGDETQLVQLFQNLIDNAIKFRGEAAPRVHISAVERDDHWLFSVHDNGIGIDPQYFERIFVVFQRLHSGGRYRGTGIGLAVCKKIVERHGGRLWVESQPGSGSTFSFTIPKSARG